MNTSEVIVPLGLKREADMLLPVAADVAQSFDAPMRIVHVVLKLDAARTDREREWLEPLATEYDATLTLIEHTSVIDGLEEVLVDSPDAIVCMSVDATGGRLDAMLGSVSEDLLRVGHQPFVLIGPEIDIERHLADGPAIVSVDGSEVSESIVPLAADWIAATSGRSWVVQVAEQTLNDSDTMETAYVHSIARKLPDGAEWEMLHDQKVAKAIVDFSATYQKASSIVMATHGRSGLGRLALGSVAISVVHQSSCPVLVKRPAALSETNRVTTSGGGPE